MQTRTLIISGVLVVAVFATLWVLRPGTFGRSAPDSFMSATTASGPDGIAGSVDVPEHSIEPPVEFLKPELIQDDIRANLAAIGQGDVDYAMQYSPPEFWVAAGGEVELRKGLMEDFGQYRDKRQWVKDVSFPGAARFVSSSRRTFAVIPVDIEWAADGWGATVNSFYLGILEPGAEHWTYLDGALLKDDLHLQLFYDYPTELILPKVVVTEH